VFLNGNKSRFQILLNTTIGPLDATGRARHSGVGHNDDAAGEAVLFAE
jgi:hypothetical protein